MSIGLYIHVPFCLKKKCDYCSFVSVPREEGLVSFYLAALAREMEMRSRCLAPGEKLVDSVYIGGGTPTCLTAGELASVLEGVHSFFIVSGGAEITVEANPDTVDSGKLAGMKKAGVNRLSIGLQACHQDLLDTLGRSHSFSGAAEVFRDARRAGYDNINIDLIFGIPGQSLWQWRQCLREVACLCPDHISAYGMQMEKNTPFFEKVRSGWLEECPEDLEAEMYEVLIDTLGGLGYVHYEISSFALPGKFCRHNLGYWHNLDYIGLGPAAHSNLGGRRFSNHPSPIRYAEMLEEDIPPVDWQEETSPGAGMSETLFLGLRLLQGLDLEGFGERFGKSVDEVYGNEIERLTALNLIERAGGRLRLTRRGLLLGNTVFSAFV